MKKITIAQSILRQFRGVCLSAGLASLALPSSTALGTDIFWDTAASGDWATGSNWTGGNPPADDTTTDHAYFTGNGDYTVSLSANRSARRLYVTGSGNPVFNFGGNTLSLGSIVNIQGGSASLTGGTLTTTQWYQGNRFSNTVFTLDGATASVTAASGALVGYNDNPTGSTASDTNTLAIKNGADFINNSTVNIGAVGNVASANRTASGNKLEVTGAGSAFTVTTIGGMNLGFINGVTTTGNAANNNSIVINDGGKVSTQLLYVGRLALGTGGAGVSTGNTVTIGGTGTGSKLNLPTSANSYSLHIGFGGATNNVVTVNAGGEINADGTNLRVYGGTGNTLRIFGGAVNDAGTILVQGNGGKLYLGAGGSLTANTLTVESGGRFGDKSDAANAGFTSGTLTLTTMTYNPTALFSVGDNSGTTPAIYNLNGGIHSFGGGITIEESEGRLTGNGTIQGLSGADTLLTVNGVLSPGNSAGTLNLTGDLVAGANAVFNFEIASLSSFDQLLLTGDAAFNGTLNVTLLDSFLPDVGDSFKLFDFSTSSGTFGVLNLAALDGGKLWDVSGLYTNGVISVIPEPSTMWLLMVCGLGFTGLPRRRRN